MEERPKNTMVEVLAKAAQEETDYCYANGFISAGEYAEVCRRNGSAPRRSFFFEAAEQVFASHIDVFEVGKAYDDDDDDDEDAGGRSAAALDRALDSLERATNAREAYLALGGRLDGTGLPLREAPDGPLVGLPEE